MKPKIWQEVKGYSVQELEHRLRDTKDKLFHAKFRHSSSPIKNPLEIRAMRRDIARYNTLLKEKASEKKA
jgi:large subunit ribosomal protein L29